MLTESFEYQQNILKLIHSIHKWCGTCKNLNCRSRLRMRFYCNLQVLSTGRVFDSILRYSQQIYIFLIIENVYSLNIEIRRVGFHETPILNKTSISILCLDENLDKGNPLVYVDFYFVVLFLV